ncbi:MAG TPA: transporter associated domain-containing protein [Gammaproteobacteria bacterium]|nr:transporter associated domain-containing protein [Gammaproteobacteria bacterium]
MKSDNDEKLSWFERLSDLLIREPKDRSQLVDVLRDAEDRDILSSEMLSMIESVLIVSEMQVREVMVPKSQMITLKKNSTLTEILPIVIESAHSRFPVIENEDVVGILLAKDLLKYEFSAKKKDFLMSDNLRPAVFVPQSKRLDILLREFRAKRNHIAIVIDEYGQVSGLVTIEDVLEQIVGDIEDEYDIDEDDDIKKHEDGSYTIKASTIIDDFNEYFVTDFNDEKFDTMGELVLNQFGHLPKRGEVITIGDYRFKVLHSDNQRIHLLEVKKEV